jgi:hypothetical protein
MASYVFAFYRSRLFSAKELFSEKEDALQEARA